MQVSHCFQRGGENGDAVIKLIEPLLCELADSSLSNNVCGSFDDGFEWCNEVLCSGICAL